MSIISIIKKPYGRTEFFKGTYTTDISTTNDKIKIRDYDFTIEVSSDLDNDFIEVSDITWTDNEPLDADYAFDLIKEEFFDKII
jgi:hypothetical protein